MLTPPPTSASSARRPRSTPSLRVLGLAGLVVALDQLSKFIVRKMIPIGTTIPVIDNVLHLTNIRNTGAAFGLLPTHQAVFILATGTVICVILGLVATGRPHRAVFQLALGLDLGGALGNLIDRVVQGRVTDFLDVRIWPVFNVADSALVVGAIVLAAALLFEPRPDSGDEGE